MNTPLTSLTGGEAFEGEEVVAVELLPVHASNLARLAKALLTERFRVEYRSDVTAVLPSVLRNRQWHEIRPYQLRAAVKTDPGVLCGFLAHSPLVLGVTEHKCWTTYRQAMFGFRSDTEVWQHLFSEAWPDCKEQAAARAFDLLQNRAVIALRMPSEHYPHFARRWRVPAAGEFDQWIVQGEQWGGEAMIEGSAA